MIHEALAELAGLHGRTETRERQLRTALDLYRHVGATGHARRVAAALEPQPSASQ